MNISAHARMEIAGIERDKTLDPTYAEAKIFTVMGERTPVVRATTMAKSVRKLLKKNFPGVKFSVRSGRGLGHVSWTDGPSSEAVKAVLGCFERNRFMDHHSDYMASAETYIAKDGSTSYEPKEGFIQFHPPTQFFCRREISEENRFDAIDKVREALGDDAFDEYAIVKVKDRNGKLLGLSGMVNEAYHFASTGGKMSTFLDHYYS